MHDDTSPARTHVPEQGSHFQELPFAASSIRVSFRSRQALRVEGEGPQARGVRQPAIKVIPRLHLAETHARTCSWCDDKPELPKTFLES